MNYMSIQNHDKPGGGSNDYLSIKIYLDNLQKTVSRTRYTIADAMGAAGGFMGLIVVGVAVFLANF
jgi:hypothetical protein